MHFNTFIRSTTCRSVCISNKRIEVYLLDVIILNLMKMHGKYSIKKKGIRVFTYTYMLS